MYSESMSVKRKSRSTRSGRPQAPFIEQDRRLQNNGTIGSGTSLLYAKEAALISGSIKVYERWHFSLQVG